MLAMDNQEVLVALLRDKKDFAILQTEGWYRIPVEHTPKRWPPDFIAFYQPKAFGGDAFRIRYYGKVKRIDRVQRRELFPNEFDSAKADKLYYRILFDPLNQHSHIIPCRLPRSVVFIPTTWHKFVIADEINDLFDESPLEDDLWAELKERKIRAERQWPVHKNDLSYRLDFAFFCNQGKLDVETDGDTWHTEKEHIALDNQRNNDIEAQGWHVMRFNTQQIKEQRAEYCLPRIQDSLNNLGGLTEDGLVPRKFFEKNGEKGQQLTLFDEKAPYNTDSDEDILD
jgi:very-short-patch-repair endonuclease